MSDLIFRLEAYRYALLAADKRMSSSSIAKLMTETIDEIERLSTHVVELEAALSWVAEHAPGIEISIAARLMRLGYTEPKHSVYHDALAAKEQDDE